MVHNEEDRDTRSMAMPQYAYIYHATYLPHKWWREYAEFGQTQFRVAMPAGGTAEKLLIG